MLQVKIVDLIQSHAFFRRHCQVKASEAQLSFFPSPPRTQEGQTALQLAISNQLPLVVDAICTRGADMSVVNDKGDPPLWLALENGLEDIASTLVREMLTQLT